MHPVLFEIGSFPVRAYGVLVMLAFVLGLWWAWRRAPAYEVPRDDVFDLAVYGLFASLIGARLTFVALNWDHFRGDPLEIVRIWHGGLSMHGVLLGAVVWCAVFARWRRHSAARLLDLVAPAIALAYPVGRLGCFLNGCCYGHAADLPWAVRFHDPAVAGGLTAPSHPAQLYAALGGLAIFALLTWRERRPHADGQIYALFFLAYSLVRFLVEFARSGATAVMAGPLTYAQWASLAMAVVGLALYVYHGRKGAARPADPSPRQATRPAR